MRLRDRNKGQCGWGVVRKEWRVCTEVGQADFWLQVRGGVYVKGGEEPFQFPAGRCVLWLVFGKVTLAAVWVRLESGSPVRRLCRGWVKGAGASGRSGATTAGAEGVD